MYPIVTENAMAFHSRYWNQGVRNGLRAHGDYLRGTDLAHFPAEL